MEELLKRIEDLVKKIRESKTAEQRAVTIYVLEDVVGDLSADYADDIMIEKECNELESYGSN